MSDSLRPKPFLDGVRLDVRAKDIEASDRQAAIVRDLATGGVRWTGAAWGDGLPDVRRILSWRIAWEHLRGIRHLVERLISRPGVHTWTLWRRITVSYTADGDRSEWILPWGHAPYVETSLPPEDLSGTHLHPWASLDPTVSEGLTVLEQDTATYDGGTPAAGECWVEQGGQRRIKLDAPPASGAVLYVALVPQHHVVIANVEPRRLRAGFASEPLDLSLREV